MKLKKYFFLLAIILGLTLIITTNTENTSYSAYSFTGGSPGALTNSPADGSTCTGCHSGALNSGPGMPSITSSGLSGGYVPGQTYTITGSIVNASINKFGFEITAERDADNSKTGTLIVTDVARTKFINGGNAVTHKSGGTGGSGNASWSFDWTAPPAGTGSITFYGAFNATNGNNGSSGDLVYTTSFQVNEIISTEITSLEEANKIAIYPNPTTNFINLNTNEKITSISIYNIEGQTIINNNNSKRIDISNFPNGIYFVSFLIDNQTITKKIIKN